MYQCVRNLFNLFTLCLALTILKMYCKRPNCNISFYSNLKKLHPNFIKKLDGTSTNLLVCYPCACINPATHAGPTVYQIWNGFEWIENSSSAAHLGWSYPGTLKKKTVPACLLVRASAQGLLAASQPTCVPVGTGGSSQRQSPLVTGRVYAFANLYVNLAANL